MQMKISRRSESADAAPDAIASRDNAEVTLRQEFFAISPAASLSRGFENVDAADYAACQPLPVSDAAILMPPSDAPALQRCESAYGPVMRFSPSMAHDDYAAKDDAWPASYEGGDMPDESLRRGLASTLPPCFIDFIALRQSTPRDSLLG